MEPRKSASVGAFVCEQLVIPATLEDGQPRILWECRVGKRTLALVKMAASVGSEGLAKEAIGAQSQADFQDFFFAACHIYRISTNLPHDKRPWIAA